MRRAKFLDADAGYYHIISRALQKEYRLNDAEKLRFMELLKWLSSVYFVRIVTFSLMTTHVHLIVKMIRESDISESELRHRFDLYYNQGKSDKQRRELREQEIPHYYSKFGDISNFMWDLKVRFSRWYNTVHSGFGHVWAERFKSVQLLNDFALRACMIYVELNAVRAKMVLEPENYPFCGLAYYVKGGKYSSWLATDLLEKAVKCYDFAVYEKGDEEGKSQSLGFDIIIRRYLEIVYREGMNLKRGKGAIPAEVLQSKDFEWLLKHTQSIFMEKISLFTYGECIGNEEGCDIFLATYKDNIKRLKNRQSHPFINQGKSDSNILPQSYLQELYTVKKSLASSISS